jgi:DNA-binding NarL/FixJ family response regulator
VSIRILLVDNHRLVRTGLRMLIESREGYRVVGEAGDPADGVAMARATCPDLILLDLDLGSGPKFDLIRTLREAAGVESTLVLIVTGVSDPTVHRHAVRLGAQGVVTKTRATESLLTAIEKVTAGELWLDRIQLGTLISEMASVEDMDGGDRQPARPVIARLTAVEREVLILVVQGLGNKDIAARLSIGDAAVGAHLTSIYSKLEVADRLSLMLLAAKYRLAGV